MCVRGSCVPWDPSDPSRRTKSMPDKGLCAAPHRPRPAQPSLNSHTAQRATSTAPPRQGTRPSPAPQDHPQFHNFSERRQGRSSPGNQA